MATQEEVLVLKLELDASSTIKTQDDLVKRNKELAKLIKKAPLEGQEGYDELADSLEKAREEYAKNRVEIVKFNKNLKDTGEASDSMKGLSKTLNQLEAQYKTLTKEEREAFGVKLKTQIQDTRTELKNLEADLGDYRRNVGNYPEVTKQNFFGLGSVVKDLGVAAAAAFTFDTIKDATQKIAEVTEQFKILRGEVQNLTGATGSELDIFTTQISAISSTFGEDTDQVLRAANALTKNLTGDFNESLKLIEDGFLSGANANGEFLDSLVEYPALIAETGATADEFIAIISQSAKEGIFSDKGVDAIKEAGLKLREQTTATQDAIIGLFGETEGKNLLGQIETGEITIIDAIQKVSGKLNELPPTSKLVGTAIADIFGGAGEDAGLEFLKSLENIDAGTGALIDTTNELTRSKIVELQAEKALAVAQNETSKRFAQLVEGSSLLATTLQTFLFSALNVIFDALAPIGTALASLGGKLRDFAERIGLVTESGGFLQFVLAAISAAFKVLAFGTNNAIALFGLLIDGLGFLYDNFTIVRVAVDATVAAFNFFRGILSSLPATFNGVIAGIQQLGTNLVDWFSTVLVSAKIFAKEIEQAFTVRQGALDRLRGEIQALEGERDNIAAAGRTIGEAFREGFSETIANIDAANAIEQADIEEPAAEAGVRAGTEFQKMFNAQIDSKDASEKLASSIPAALETALEESSVDALRAKVSELQKILGTLAPDSALFLETAEKVKEATEKLSEAEEIRKQALLSEDEILKQKQADAEQLEADLKAAAAKALDNRRAEINLEVAEAKRAAQIIRDTKLANDELTAEQREAINEEFNQTITEQEIEAEKQRLSLLEAGSLERLNLEAKIAEQELAIRQQFYEDDVQKSLEAEEEKNLARETFGAAALEIAKTVSDAAFTIASNNLERETQASLDKLDTETQAKLDAATGNEAAQLRIKEDAEAKKAKIEESAAKKRKEQAIIQAIINGALAAISTLANTTVPYPAAFALLIPTAVAVAAQIAVIESSKFEHGRAPEEFKASRGRIAKGRLHSQGGIPARIDGTEPVEIESNEAIINRVSSMRHNQTLSDINQDGGGIRFPGTARLTPERRKRINLFSNMSSQFPILARRGMSPRIQSLITKKRKFQDGAVAEVENVKIPVSGLSEKDVLLIARAAEAGTKAGIEKARIFEQFKRQTEREEDLEERANV